MWNFDPLVAVIVTVYDPALIELQDNVALPEPDMVPGDIDWHVTPDGRGTSESVTEPANPFTAVTVIVDVADTPVAIAAGEVALILKSVNLKVTVVV